MGTLLVLVIFSGLITIILGILLPDVDVVGQMIKSKGYPFEAHQVQTQDGYLLKIHRIPYGLAPGAGEATGKPVCFFMHGLFSSSADLIATGPDNDAPGYYFADQGCDVWMGNARGNTWSRKNIYWDPDNLFTRPKFWNFSFHEISIFDVPAMIDYTLNVTKQTKLHYIGHSQGATNLFVMLSMLPKYNDIIDTAHALSPLAYFSNTISPLFRGLAPLIDELHLLGNLIGVYEFAASNELFQLAGYNGCMDSSPTQIICKYLIFLIAGFDSDQLNTTTLSTIFSNTPAGASTKQVVHYEQLINSGRFCEYDHGPLGNLAVYGELFPPEYPVENITAPIYLHYGLNDWIVVPEDTYRIRDRLQNVEAIQVDFPLFTHIDFIWAKDVRKLLLDKMSLIMKLNVV